MYFVLGRVVGRGCRRFLGRALVVRSSHAMNFEMWVCARGIEAESAIDGSCQGKVTGALARWQLPALC